MSRPLPEQLVDLLVSDVTEGLDAAGQSELEQLLRANPEADPPSWERAAAVAHLALLDSMPGAAERMPEGLRSRLVGELMDAPTPAAGTAPSGTAPAGRPGREGAGDGGGKRSGGAPLRDLGWYLAAGIAVVWVGTQWLTGIFPPGGGQPEAPGLVQTPPPAAEPTARERRAELLASAPDVERASWSQKVDPYQQVSGDVVWSTSRQEGYMRLVGMPPNDAAVSQYQLWIVDPARDEEPVDGGVFDVADTGEIVVPIDAKLEVLSPAAFAITREKPGGVVVSEGPLLVVASL